MFKLCPLILVFWIGFQTAMGAGGKIGIDIVSTEQKGTVDVFRIDNNQSATSSLLRLSLQLPTLKNYWTVAISLDADKKDYGNFLLRNDRGEETPLSDTFDGEEYSGNLSISYQKGNHAFAGLLAGSFNSTPFSFVSTMASYKRTFLNKKRILGGTIYLCSKGSAQLYVYPPQTHFKPESDHARA